MRNVHNQIIVETMIFDGCSPQNRNKNKCSEALWNTQHPHSVQRVRPTPKSKWDYRALKRILEWNW